ncbi:hypothetical protein E6B08_17625 [Pseudomonas putida]|uniref:Uncharacterized protein n=1 Tax=Pseudomonas putida TaxID=303 RepID=A0A4D6XEQ4_PSEPU|nr:hypothetical protein [Pseudomonas putida]QCI13078.1 hypothetical protein E6B08_17625 [Pseudomonas putida]
MNEINAAQAAELVAGIQEAGVAVIGARALKQRLVEPGEPALTVHAAIFTAGAHGITFHADPGGIDQPALVETFSAVVRPDQAVVMAELLSANLAGKPAQNGNIATARVNAPPHPKENGTFEGIRSLVRHMFPWAIALCLAALVYIAFKHDLDKATKLGLVMFTLLTTVWFYSTKDTVHGPKFRNMTRTAKINTVLRLFGLCMSVAAISYVLPTLFR